tara:strand:- start:155 stop:352 length:198 start_codon:yes stop_codon:yes gene_type:complete
MIRITLNKPIDMQRLMAMINKDIVNHAKNHHIKDSVLCIDIQQIADTLTIDNKYIELKKSEVKDA